MNRRTFISTSSTASLGALLPFNSFSRSPEKDDSWGRALGFLIPILIDKGIDALFDAYEKWTSPQFVVDESIRIINENHNGDYNSYYNTNIRPRLGKKSLNGQGYREIDGDIRSKMHGKYKYATTPVHSIRDFADSNDIEKNFDPDLWSNFCDNSNLQVDDIGNVEVSPTDNRPIDYKGVFTVYSDQSYLIYDPNYFCVGLPTEDPVRHSINGTLFRDIRDKTGIKPTVESYYTQHFHYQGESCKPLGGNQRTIYWGYDDAISKYCGLTDIETCGDPSDNCKDGTDREIRRIRRS